MLKRMTRGFTLAELLIAAAIFSLIILSIYSAFHTGILSYRRIDSAFEVYQSARLIFNRLESDLKNSFAYTQNNSNFSGSENTLSFFSLLDTYDNGNISQALSRIVYESTADVLNDTAILKRTCYQGLDALQDFNVEAKESSYDIKAISFQYANATTADPPYEWQEQWPKDNSRLPLAVKIGLNLTEENKRQGGEGNEIGFSKTVPLPAG